VDSDCSLFTFVVYVVVFGTIVVFGLVGNGLSWVVLAWDRQDRGRVAAFLLRTMAVADNLFLLSICLSVCLSVCLSAGRPVRPSVRLSINPSIHPSTSLCLPSVIVCY